MRQPTGLLFFLIMLLMPCSRADALLVTVNEQDRMDALQKGKAQGSNVSKYINKHYRFGGGKIFEESGIIRTKWSKLVLLSGLMAEKDLEPTKQEQLLVLTSTDLQIDIHVYGDQMDFANEYTIHLVQKGKRIEAEKISADDVAYAPQKRSITSGFPRYRATIRAYFAYDKIAPDDKTQIVLVKNKTKVLFEVNFANYK